MWSDEGSDQVARVTTARDTDTERDLLGDRVYARDDCRRLPCWMASTLWPSGSVERSLFLCAVIDDVVWLILQQKWIYQCNPVLVTQTMCVFGGQLMDRRKKERQVVRDASRD